MTTAPVAFVSQKIRIIYLLWNYSSSLVLTVDALIQFVVVLVCGVGSLIRFSHTCAHAAVTCLPTVMSSVCCAVKCQRSQTESSVYVCAYQRLFVYRRQWLTSLMSVWKREWSCELPKPHSSSQSVFNQLTQLLHEQWELINRMTHNHSSVSVFYKAMCISTTKLN